MSNWTGLDFLIFLIFLVNTLLGMSRGATKEIISMICLSAALIFTIKFTLPLTNFFNSSPLIQNVLDSSFTQNFMDSIGAQTLTADTLHEVGYTVSLLICFVGVFSICEAVLTFTGFVEVYTFPYATLSRKVGAGLGAARGYVISVMLILVLMHINIPKLTSGSYFVSLFQGTAMRLDSLISKQDFEQYKDVFKEKDLYNVDAVLKPVSGN